MKDKGVNNVCPQCRGEMTEAEELFHAAVDIWTYIDQSREMSYQNGDKARRMYSESLGKLQQVVAIDPRHSTTMCTTIKDGI
jgi:hypothetical protein